MPDENESRQDADELAACLRSWAAPAPSQRLDARVLESYRSRPGVSRWRKLWSVRVSLPLPMAVLLAILVLVAADLATRGLRARREVGADPELAMSPTGLADLRPLPDVRLRVIREGGKE